jgi:hypothetical protein
MVTPRLADYNVASWCPIDHFPVPPAVRDFFDRSKAVPVAMSRFGERNMFDIGLDPVYVPLSVDTNAYKPTNAFVGEDGTTISARELLGVPEDAFVVGMVAMNKGWAKDRKGFNEAFFAFGQFIKTRPDAVLYLHSEKYGGAEGINIEELRIHAGIPDTNLVWADQYAYRVGYTPDMMAAMYSAFDVLLAPSHGEGFCVPLIEAQACGTPVIATDFSAQSELIGAGWALAAQPEWDPPQHALFVCPLIDDIVAKLHTAYEYDLPSLTEKAVAFAAQYDTDVVFDKYWKPFLADLEAPAQKLDVTREAMPDTGAVAVLVPIHKRTEHIEPLVESFRATTKPGEATLYFVIDENDAEAAQTALSVAGDDVLLITTDAESCAAKWNVGFTNAIEPWVLCVGDDVRFHEGWLDAARKLSDRFDVIGTNDSVPPRTRNPKVASGAHADHFFVRRAYVMEHGASLEGEGILAPEVYRHWYVDKEIVELARARGVFTPCLDSIVEHLHPGYDGNETARHADPTYMVAVEHGADDAKTFKERNPLIQMQRTTRARV